MARRAVASQVVIIALGLANEGLLWAAGDECDAVAKQFLLGLRTIAEVARRRWAGVAVVFGGCYPRGRRAGTRRRDEARFG